MSKITPEQLAAALSGSKKSPQNNIIGVDRNKVIDVSVSFDDIDNFGNADSIKEMYEDIASYNRMIKERITFINPALTDACLLYTSPSPRDS